MSAWDLNSDLHAGSLHPESFLQLLIFFGGSWWKESVMRWACLPDLESFPLGDLHPHPSQAPMSTVTFAL